jgi:hypothetical protein
MKFNLRTFTFEFSFPVHIFQSFLQWLEKYSLIIIVSVLSLISILSFVYFLSNGTALAYNDARSHLDIGRRVVENLKPGFAQLGSVWLPLPHLLMTVTIWNDFMWHTGLSGALQSMVSFLGTAVLIYLFLKRLGVGLFGRFVGVLFFVINMNILYMQSTAMTELLLLATMTAGVYELMMWHKEESLFRLISSAFWIMLSTLIRYDGWFLLIFALGLIVFHAVRKHGLKTAEGVAVLFLTLAGFGIFIWLLWNLMIFKDPLYFAFGPYSAHSQQLVMEKAGALPTKHNFLLSFKTYWYALVYNSGFFSVLLSVLGLILLWFDKKIEASIKFGISALLAPFFFNILALYLGHSVLYVQDLSGSWFNVRYGLMMMPAVAVFGGYLLHRARSLRYVLLGLFLFVSFFAFINRDAVTIDDARVGASGKNVTEVSGWLKSHAANTEGFVLISVASHDAIIFSSDMPMSRFIHEGTGVYWDAATAHPDKWARWIIMRTNDESDTTFKLIGHNAAFKKKYQLVHSYPFADIYEIKPEYVSQLETKAVLAGENK